MDNVVKEFLQELAYDPYPTDIFPEVSNSQIHQLHEFCMKEFGFPIDRFSAHVARTLRKPLSETAKQLLNNE